MDRLTEVHHDAADLSSVGVDNVAHSCFELHLDDVADGGADRG